MKIQNAGLIGCGAIARRHKQAFEESGVKVTAFADTNLDAAREVADGGGAVFSSHQELFEAGGVDIVAICTPPAFHEEPAIAALERGIHVLCEKPLAHNAAAARRIVEAVDKSEASLMCAFRHRFIPAVVKMRSLVEEIGPVVLFQNVFAGPNFQVGSKWFANPAISGGGCLPDTASHSVDLFRHLIGEIRSSRVITATHLPDVTVEDAAILSVEADNKALGSLVSSWVSGVGVVHIDIIGQRGRMFYDYTVPEIVKILRSGETAWTSLPVESGNGFAAQTAHFLSAIQGEEVQLCTAEDALRTLEVIAAAL